MKSCRETSLEIDWTQKIHPLTLRPDYRYGRLPFPSEPKPTFLPLFLCPTLHNPMPLGHPQSLERQEVWPRRVKSQSWETSLYFLIHFQMSPGSLKREDTRRQVNATFCSFFFCIKARVAWPPVLGTVLRAGTTAGASFSLSCLHCNRL